MGYSGGSYSDPIGTTDAVAKVGTYHWNTTSLAWERSTGGTTAGQDVNVTNFPGTQPVSGTVTANPATYFGKTITFVSVAQGAAGTTALAGASVGNKHKLLGASLVMSATGTLKFADGVADLTGAMDIAANGGFVFSTSICPYFETGATNRALNLVTTVGLAKGFVIILTEA